MKNIHLKKLITSALFAALCCIATILFTIALPTGYANLGDGIAFLAGFVLGGPWGFFAAAIGSLFADLIGGFAIYIPATFIIKGLIGLFGALAFKFVTAKKRFWIALVFSLIGEILMILLYFIFEAFVLGVGEAAAASVVGNIGQGIVGIVLSMALCVIFIKNKKLFEVINNIKK